MKAYMAYGGKNFIIKMTPRDAALAYFEAFPKSRKCSVTEGEDDGYFFTVALGQKGSQSWKDVTKKTAGDLPC